MHTSERRKEKRNKRRCITVDLDILLSRCGRLASGWQVRSCLHVVRKQGCRIRMLSRCATSGTACGAATGHHTSVNVDLVAQASLTDGARVALRILRSTGLEGPTRRLLASRRRKTSGMILDGGRIKYKGGA